MGKIDTIKSLIKTQGLIRSKIHYFMKEFFESDSTSTPLQLEAMMLLFEKQELSMKEFASIMNLKTSGATQLINILVTQNKIVRKTSIIDKRIIHVSLTKECQVLVKKMKSRLDKIMVKMYDTLEHNELETLLQITNKINSTI